MKIWMNSPGCGRRANSARNMPATSRTFISKYTKYNGRRKPEMLAPDTYSLVNYQEAETVVADFKTIAAQAEEIYDKLPADRRDAFYELVLFPDQGLRAGERTVSRRREKRVVSPNRAGRAPTILPRETRALFQADTNLMAYFNHTFAGGKWDHFMDQTHLGYTTWQDPPHNSLRAIKLAEIDVPDAAAMGVAVEGSESAWPDTTDEAVLPQFDVFNQQRHYIDVFKKAKRLSNSPPPPASRGLF